MSATPPSPAPGPRDPAAPVLEITVVDGIGEVRAGDDLGALLTALPLVDGDIVTVTSKIVSKAEDRASDAPREALIESETVRLVARRGETRIVENRLGLVMAAAGVDASNVEPGTALLLPVDPDASARRLRDRVLGETGHNVAVLITDTAGRAWRTGQTDLALGAAGLLPLQEYAGSVDGYGNPLAVTAPAVADEIASATQLITGKVAARPIAVVRGLSSLVLPPGEHGPGARALLRPRAEDLFALGAREAVIAALALTDGDCFGAPATPAEVVGAAERVGLSAREDGDHSPGLVVVLPQAEPSPALARLRVLAHALAWEPVGDVTPAGGALVRLSPRAPGTEL